MCTGLSKRKCLFVDNQKLYDKIIYKLTDKSINQKFAIGLDTETSVNETPIRLALIQISTNTYNIIFDATKLDISSFGLILDNENIIKVIQYSQYEKQVFKQFGWDIVNIYDTYIASKVKAKENGVKVSHSLKAIVKREFHIDISKKEQSSNWFVRPLSDDQLKYAYMDSELVLMLYNNEIPLYDDIDGDIYDKNKLYLQQ